MIGCQVGDEGKLKVLTYFASQVAEIFASNPILADYYFSIIRPQGSTNSGHTGVVKGRTHKMHGVSSGIMYDQCFALNGKKMYIPVRKIVAELGGHIDHGLNITPDNFGIAANAHVTLDHHLKEDQAAFSLKEHSSTGSGVMQTSRDKYGRTGMRFVEWLDHDLTVEIFKEKMFKKGLGNWARRKFTNHFERLSASYDSEREFLGQFLVEENDILQDPRNLIKLFEMSQGSVLDIDSGEYDGITGSNPLEIPYLSEVIVGAFKSYVSSVGIHNRSFVTEMDAALADVLRDPFGEYGTTTGKPRHIGWFDIPQAKYAIDVGQVTHLALTKLDTMEEFAKIGHPIKVAVAYRVNGQRHTRWDASFLKRGVLKNNAVPEYIEVDPWERTVEDDGQTLTPGAQNYVNRLEELLERKFSLVGIGPADDEMIVYENPLSSPLDLILHQEVK